MPLLVTENLMKRYTTDDPVVDGISFDVKRDEVFVLLGESGCGKTTTLRVIAGFEHAESGKIVLDGRVLLDISGENQRFECQSEKRQIGFVFQDYALFPHMSVFQNIEFGLQGGQKINRKDRRQRVQELLALVGIEELAHRKPHEISGGQQQRVAIARAIAPSPKLVLLDEPFSSLDAGLRAQTRAEVRSLLKREGISAILVTHDQEEALSFADRIAVMHQGKIEQIGRSEEIYRRPSTEFVAAFLGRTNLMRAVAHQQIAETTLGMIRMNHKVKKDNTSVLICMRPEHLSLRAPQPGSPVGIVTQRIYKGHDLSYQVNVQGERYEVHTDYRCAFVPGDSVNVIPIENAVLLEEPVHNRS